MKSAVTFSHWSKRLKEKPLQKWISYDFSVLLFQQKLQIRNEKQRNSEDSRTQCKSLLAIVDAKLLLNMEHASK